MHTPSLNQGRLPQIDLCKLAQRKAGLPCHKRLRIRNALEDLGTVWVILFESKFLISTDPTGEREAVEMDLLPMF